LHRQINNSKIKRELTKMTNMAKEIDFYQVSLKVFLKNEKNEILLLEAGLDTSFAGYYDLPGGRIDTDELTVPFFNIIKREISEEIGDINYTLGQAPVAVGRHLVPAAIAKNGQELHVLYLFFEAQYINGDITISNEHIGYKWVDFSKENPKKLLKSGMLEGMRMYLANF
jgi:8-oxo-dGTP diphosphatase